MDPPIRPIVRAALPAVLDALRTFRVVAITGPRQAGKTTLAREILGHRPGTFLSLDDDAVLAALHADPRTFLARDGLVVLDEFQRGGEQVLRAIKRRVDEIPRKGQFLLTGSTRFLTVPTLSESLAGRVGLVELWPLSQGELSGRADGFLDRLFGPQEALRAVRVERQTRAEVLELVCAGGFPELRGATATARERWYDSYVRTVTRRDVPEISNVHRPEVLERTLELLAARTAQELNVAALSVPTRTPESTLSAHLSLLETVHLWYRLPAWSRNLTQKVVRHPKAHLVDSGLASHVLRVDPSALAIPGAPTLGPLIETFAVGEIARQATWSRVRADLRHFRDRDGLEVDLVLEARDGRVALVEVKASASVDAKDFRPLERLGEKVGGPFAHGVVLYLGHEVVPMGPRRTALPLSALWAP